MLKLFALWSTLPPFIDALQRVRKSLAHMSEQQDGIGEGVEYPAADDAQGVRGGLDGPVPDSAAQARVSLVDFHLVGFRVGRVQVDGDAKLFGALPNTPELTLVQVLAVGMPIDQRALEAQ